MSDHVSDAFGGAAVRACRRSFGTSGSGSTATGAISNVTRSPASAPAVSRTDWSTFSQWPPCPSGSRVARKAEPLRVPSTDVIPREGSFALASFGRVRKVHDSVFAAAFGRRSFAVKRILEAVLVIISSPVVLPPPNDLPISRRKRTAKRVKMPMISRAKRSAAWACSAAVMHTIFKLQPPDFES